MSRTGTLPVFARGMARVGLALKASLRGYAQPAVAPCQEQFVWDDSLLRQEGAVIRGARSLSDLGYTSSPHQAIDVKQITAVSEVHGLFSQAAITALQTICRQLESHAGNSDWIISRRTRGVTELSPFISAMMNSRRFLLAVSGIAGVPLVPYPMINARSQINYYYPVTAGHQRQQLGMWHTDGTSYVLNIVLSAQQDYSGGEFLFHNGTVDTFDQAAEHHSSTEVASLSAAGDALFIYGSRLFHGVKPVRQGQRMSLVLSFHCPYTREDANRFWHLASDDGIPATIRNWRYLQRALTVPAVQQYQALGIEPIRFDELLSKEPDQRNQCGYS